MGIRSKTIGYALLGALLTAELASSIRIVLDHRSPGKAANASEASGTPRASAAPASDRKARQIAEKQTRTAAESSDSVILGAEAFRRDGMWELVRRFDGRLNGESVRSFRVGSSATLAFVGRAVRLYGVVGRGGGRATIELDGRFVRSITFYAPQKVAHRLLFSSARLPRGVHRLKVSVAYEGAGTSPRRHYVNIEGADIRT